MICRTPKGERRYGKFNTHMTFCRLENQEELMSYLFNGCEGIDGITRTTSVGKGLLRGVKERKAYHTMIARVLKLRSTQKKRLTGHKPGCY